MVVGAELLARQDGRALPVQRALHHAGAAEFVGSMHTAKLSKIGLTNQPTLTMLPRAT